MSRCKRAVWCEDGHVKICYPSSGNVHWLKDIPENAFMWACKKRVLRILSLLFGNKRYTKFFSNPSSFRSLILLLYARCIGVPPYKMASLAGTHPEQLYRVERRLKKLGIRETLMFVLGCNKAGNSRRRKQG